MGVLARHWEQLKDKYVRCLLCPHICKIADGKSGLCIIRKNIDGMLQQTAYGELCSISIDPIEKKPLYHFYPGKEILSVGTNGCNMRCRHCQNWPISTQETNRQKTAPGRLRYLSKNSSSVGIAYTYNEPVVWYEFVYDCAKEVHKEGEKNVLVTNGQINAEPLKELLPLLDAANIDLKGFTEQFYKDEAGDLSTTINTITEMYKSGIHIEITNLLIPSLNDKPEIFEEMCRFINSLSKDIPLHISRYFPQHKSECRITSDEMLTEYRNYAEKHLNYVYTGNASILGTSDTTCPECGSRLIERTGYTTVCRTDKNICPDCSQHFSVVF